ncbi:hypothetical protein PP182_02465 [Maribacter sp. PR1]|uniref:DUF4760 domain-containing protein n=1 Tax=Maribacter cobaltidurans TaxID=1178778 RepID=A0ABU7IPP1_9FLAO|nr:MULTISPECIES: hypothetical protein [Maribacter]MDC6387529.1 hypothetical protein [Maribacter sp. PR1]MEE1974916.1 hypothetical protein [Maribacter cobaltidurans]
MNTQTIITLLSIVLPIFGLILGYFIKHNIEKKKELISEIAKERRDIYQQYVNLIIGIFANSKTNKNLNQDRLIKDLFEFYKKYVLYASPAVIKAFSNYFQLIYHQDTESGIDIKTNLLHMTKIMAEMRKDLGLNNKGLGKNGEVLMRAILKDYDIMLR